MTGIMLAAGWISDPLPGFGPMSPAVKERFIILGALVAAALIALAWVLLFRSRRLRSARREERRRRRQSFGRHAARSVTELREYVKHRRGRRRREHRPRNPTLAETGGLPPVRSEGNPPPPAQPN